MGSSVADGLRDPEKVQSWKNWTIFTGRICHHRPPQNLTGLSFLKSSSLPPSARLRLFPSHHVEKPP
ncbi:hypothetical protein Ancab_021768, partial [Ancistrocladus abbreviatus]